MPLDDASGREPEPPPPTLIEAAREVVEYARSFLFALTDHDKPHQEHFRAQLEAWLDTLAERVAEHEQNGGPPP